MFSNKSKLKLKPIKDSSIGMLRRAPEPAGNKLLAARATMQGDKTSFSASSAGRWDGSSLHTLSLLWVGVASGTGPGDKGRQSWPKPRALGSWCSSWSPQCSSRRMTGVG